ncbi:MAG: ABC transporter permease [Bradyrhizobiaceae bacterium]|nr:MAG: ABC transporter permease [Bradyrhizobiaceae bacterium]
MLLGFVLFLSAWYLAVDIFKLPRFSKLPGLRDVITEWLSPNPVYGISIFTPEYYQHIFVSLVRIGTAFVAATILGVPLGLMLGWSERFREYVFPVFETLRPIPILAWVPISIILFNGSEVSVVFLTFIAAFFVTTLNTMQGVRSIDETYIRAAACLGATPNQIFMDVVIPGALPSIFTGLQISIGVAWFSLVAAEMVSGEYGLGYLINTSYTKIQYPTIAIGMFTLGIVGYLSSSLVRLLGNRLMKWRMREIGASS